MRVFRLNLMLLAACAAMLASGFPLAAEQAPKPAVTTAKVAGVDQYVQRDSFLQLKISPDGQHLAATVPVENRVVLVVFRRKDMQRTAIVNVPPRTRVEGFWWANDRRVLLTTSEQNGAFAQRYLTGEIWGTDVDGKNQDLLVGSRRSGGLNTESRIKSRHQELIAAEMVDSLLDDDDHVLVAITPLTAGEDPYTTLDRMHVVRGNRQTIARAPVRNASFVVDHEHVARFAQGAGADNKSRLYYRPGRDAEWELINDQAQSTLHMRAVGFSADDSTAYLFSERESGPGAILGFDVATRKQSLLAADKKVDPAWLHLGADAQTPFAIQYLDGLPRQHYLVEDVPEARLLKSMHKAFPGQAVVFSGFTRDGNSALVYVYSDRNPGDFYLFDIAKKEATHLAARRAWVDPERMATVRGISFQARDGRTIHGFLTVPAGSDGKNLPVVVTPHGGPFDIYDEWTFDADNQLLASRGFAVLQVNFRGSGNYGRDHVYAGYRQWGGTMQDDVTDATRWLVSQGIADAKRICIYGASYGGYAALMGAAKEPDLYACAVGYIGVYDLPLMHADGDVRDRESGANYLEETLGTDRQRLGANSPARIASRIKVPVFLAAGGIDERAPIRHSKMMRDALTEAGNAPEWLAFDDEGHAFEQDAHRVEYYTKLLAFLDRHIGPDAKP